MTCFNDAKFPADVTIPDNSEVEAGAAFTKTWRVENSGDCEWGTGYHLVYAGGQRLGGAAKVPLGKTVKPGEQLEVSVSLAAPMQPGSYTGECKLQNAKGVAFGFRGNPLTVVIKGPRRPSAQATARVGLHGRADGPLNLGDLNAIRSKEEKGRQYVEWLAQLDGPMAAFAYISSASEGYEHETWVEKDQSLSAIPGAGGKRPCR